jgi:hypothetical protein
MLDSPPKGTVEMKVSHDEHLLASSSHTSSSFCHFNFGLVADLSL